MPKGIPVGTLAIGEDGAINAAILASQILSIKDMNIRKKILKFKKFSVQSS